MSFFSGNRKEKKTEVSFTDKQRELETKYLLADTALQVSNYIESKRLLEEIIKEDALFFQAYNSLAWIYANAFTDYDKAEQLYQFVITNFPQYHHPYSNYVWLLIEQERFKEAEIVMRDALRIPAINKSDIYYKFGEMYELEGKFNDAIAGYKRAIFMSLNTDRIEACNRAIERVEHKIEMKNNY